MQYKSDPDDAYYRALDIFSISHLTGKIGEPPMLAQNADRKMISVQAPEKKDTEGIPVHVPLQDDKKLSEYAIENQSTFRLVQRMPHLL